MALLNWIGEHPILSFFLAYLLMVAIIGVAAAIASAFTPHCTCECSKPTTPETAKDKE